MTYFVRDQLEVITFVAEGDDPVGALAEALEVAAQHQGSVVDRLTPIPYALWVRVWPRPPAPHRNRNRSAVTPSEA